MKRFLLFFVAVITAAGQQHLFSPTTIFSSGNTFSSGELRFMDFSNQYYNYFRAGGYTHSMTSNVGWELPGSDAVGFFKSDGAGHLTVSGVGAPGTFSQIWFSDVSGNLQTSPHFSWLDATASLFMGSNTTPSTSGTTLDMRSDGGPLLIKMLNGNEGLSGLLTQTFLGSGSTLFGLLLSSQAFRGTGDAVFAPAAIQANDHLFTIKAAGYDGTSTGLAVQIDAAATNNFSGSDHSSHILFSTVAPTSNTLASTFRMAADVNTSYAPLTATAGAGAPALTALTGYVLSQGGFLSSAALWNSFQGDNDGALLRGYAVAPNVGNTAGGYVDFAPIQYYTPSSTCKDVWGNPVTQPQPLPGLSSFGTYDLLEWVSSSPLQGYSPPYSTIGGNNIYNTGTACASPVHVDYPGFTFGINTNGYYFARGGFASDLQVFNTLHLFNGGVVAQSITAAGFYPVGTVTTTGTLSSVAYLGGYVAIGHSLGPPIADGNLAQTISGYTNPLTWGDGLNQGTIYWEDGSSSGAPCVNAYDGGAWHCLAQQSKSVTFNGITATGAISAVGVISSTGSSGGINVTSQIASNSIQTVGGMKATLGYQTDQALYPKAYASSLSLNTPAGGYGGLGYKTGAQYWYYNGSAWASIDFSAIGGGVTSITGTPNEIIASSSTGAVTLSTPQAIGTGSSPTFANLTVSSTITGNLVNSTIGYQVNSSTSINGSNQFVGTAVNVSGVVQSQITGTSIAFQTSNTNFQVNGNGDISAAGQVNLTGGGSTYKMGGTTVINTSGQFVGTAVNAVGAIQSQITGTSIAFQTSNFNFQVDGNGNISAAGQVNLTGGSSAYKMGGTTVVNAAKQFVGNGVDVASNGINAGGYNINGGFFGQTATLQVACTIAGTTYLYAEFKGGVVITCHN
jgi:hypothetical protein